MLTGLFALFRAAGKMLFMESSKELLRERIEENSFLVRDTRDPFPQTTSEQLLLLLASSSSSSCFSSLLSTLTIIVPR
jgi:hypothetical protein